MINVHADKMRKRNAGASDSQAFVFLLLVVLSGQAVVMTVTTT